jgi:type VI secretion system protein ImpG
MDKTQRHYHTEMRQLRESANEFAQAHPADAPMLMGDPSSDPDVERLLEGAAYLTAQLNQKLEESYERIAEDLSAIVLPQLLRDIPSCAVICFTPQSRNFEIIPKDSTVKSKPDDGVSCTFSTKCAVELALLSLAGVELDDTPGRPPSLRLNFSLAVTGALDKLSHLRLHLTGSHTNAAHRLSALLFYTTGISLEAGATRLRLQKNSLRPVGFDPDEGLFPYPDTAWNGYRLLQEYFVFPEKFLFLDIILSPDVGIQFREAKSLSCVLELKTVPDDLKFAKDDFALFATPAVNLFPYDTQPITVDHRQESYPVRANVTKKDAYVPFQVEKVTRTGRTGEERLVPALTISPDPSAISYSVQYLKNAREKREMRLLVHPHDGHQLETMRLSLDVLYSNGDLPSRLEGGAVNNPGFSTTLAKCSNLAAPTKPVQAPADRGTLWPMLAHLYLNYLPLADAQSLKKLLSIYLPQGVDARDARAHKQRIEAIVSLESRPKDFLLKGRPIRGYELTLILDANEYSKDPGNMCLFGMVVARFLHECSPVNSLMEVCVLDSLNNEIFRWIKDKLAPTRP